MPLTKRIRFEILKRDNHTCRYCGASAPEATLTVDHVLPLALGGTDQPNNLVAACKDCNAGKSSTDPDAQIVADVREVDLRFAEAMFRVSIDRATTRQERAEYADDFLETWESWTWGNNKNPFPLPSNWRVSVQRFYDLGIDIEELQDMALVALTNERLDPHDTFRYFTGCAWRAVAEIQEAAKSIMRTEPSHGA